MNRWLWDYSDRYFSRIGFNLRRSALMQRIRWSLGQLTFPPSLRRLLPRWVYLSLACNVLLGLLTLQLWLHQHWLNRAISLIQTPSTLAAHAFTVSPSSPLGPQQQLNYDQWVDLLAQEAQVVAQHQPQQLTILLGDSISLWFPQDLLLPHRTWLNQGISGETSTGLRKRLALLDQTDPQTILLMIGINDLLRGEADEVILRNHRQIVHYLKQAHPTTEIVVQSILPHAGTDATWEGRDRLLTISNQRILELNQRLAAIAQEEGGEFLDLYPLFVDAQGNLPMSLSTDGLHLNTNGYLVWCTGLRMYFYHMVEARG